MKKRPINTCTKGNALVEFAILLPVFVTLVLGTIEAGWALFIQNTLVDAAREGARVAVTQNISTNSIVSDAEGILTDSNISLAQVSVSISPLAVSLQPRGTAITVTVSVPYSAVSILPTPMFLGSTTLSAQVTMVKEY